MDALHVRTLRLATGTHLLSIIREGELRLDAPTLADALMRAARYEDVLLNLEDATPVESVLAYAAIVSSPRVRESVRPLAVVSNDDTLHSLLDSSDIKHHVLVDRSLEDAVRFLAASRWLSSFAEIAAYASTSP